MDILKSPLCFENDGSVVPNAKQIGVVATSLLREC